MCTQTFSHLYGRSSCRNPEGPVGDQGHLQGGRVALCWWQSLLSCPVYLPPWWVSPWELRRLPGPRCSFSAGRRKRGSSRRRRAGCAISCCRQEVRNPLHPSSAQILHGAAFVWDVQGCCWGAAGHSFGEHPLAPGLFCDLR